MQRSFDAFLLTLVVLIFGVTRGVNADDARVVSYYGYDDCIRLSNAVATVTLCPAAGGRVLEYSIAGKNVLYLPDGDEGWTYKAGDTDGPMNAGRFDIGPEKRVRRGPLLWMGRWRGEITGESSAKLTSQTDPLSGVRLIRSFELDSKSSRLLCTQTIENVSDQPVSLCYWSRTFVVGGGVAVIPRSPLGRFPNGYVMYPDGNHIDLRPVDANIEVTHQEVVVRSAPRYPKLGFDSHSGWLAYVSPTDHLFVKRFPTFPQRAYNEVAGLTASVWYPKKDLVEIEPIGPAENLDPGQAASFSVEWWLLPVPFDKGPFDKGSWNAARVRRTFEGLTQTEL